ncbi:hypothetical protein EV361DRAFT_407064 [Lentinula raphanica]|nr:hypothetical protein EV361DRAFT_407064 [Lentinula raphanica]
MKKLPKSQYRTDWFQKVVKTSGLSRTIETICDPTFIILNRDPEMLWLEHAYRIGDQLGEILDTWTPQEVAKSWSIASQQFVVTQTGGTPIRTAHDFIEVFNTHDKLVPGEENISYCFFMTSLSNFRYAFDRWLGVTLVHLGYNVSRLTNEQSLHTFYDQLIWQISEWCKQLQRVKDQDTQEEREEYVINVKYFKNERWRSIIKYTWWLRQVARQASKHAKNLKHCQKCAGLPGDKRCCQFVYMPHITTDLEDDEAQERLRTLVHEMTGAGVSLVPREKQIKGRVVKSGKQRKTQTTERKIYHPDSIGESKSFGLDELGKDEEVIGRCGHQLLLVLNEVQKPTSPIAVNWDSVQPSTLKDFVWFGAFEKDKLALLQDAVVESTGVEPVTRGRQFESYMGGEMTPLGSRSPSGGRAGDAYTSYSGLEASTERGLAILFKQAATSAMMLKVASQAHPELTRRLKTRSEECDQLGMMGANLFNCTGYMAPIHRDKDATSGLSVQALLEADTEYKEYGFCNIEHQYYITTATNCICFDAGQMHGTMLPSKTTIRDLDSRAIDPDRFTGDDLNEERKNLYSAATTAAAPSPDDHTRKETRTKQSKKRPRGRVVAGWQEGSEEGLRRSTRTVQLSRKRVTVSNGAHVAVPSRNRARAIQNARRRGQYEERSKYWRL